MGVNFVLQHSRRSYCDNCRKTNKAWVLMFLFNIHAEAIVTIVGRQIGHGC